MNARPKTIQIYLPGGDPQGIRIAEITTRIVQVIEVPRSLLGEFNRIPESKQVGLYFLISDSDDGDASVYIGQTGNLQARLSTHHREKDFWDRAMVVTSRTNSLTQTHVLFLEWFCLQKCREFGRYSDHNGNAASEPFTPAPMRADCHEVFETASTLLSTLGFPAFQPIAKTSTSEVEVKTYYCKRGGANGKGQYTAEGLVLLKGSTGHVDVAPNLQGKATERRRDELLRKGIYEVKGGKIVMLKDHAFSSPSSAAAFLLGKASNGWLDWKDEQGRTLDEVLRQDTADAFTGEEQA